jgi:hypothetical protein
MILNSDFQKRVFDLVALRTVAEVIDDSIGMDEDDSLHGPTGPTSRTLEPAGQVQAELCHLTAAAPMLFSGGIVRVPSLDQICTAQYAVTETIIRTSRVVVEPPALGTVGDLQVSPVAHVSRPWHHTIQQHQTAGIQEALQGEEKDLKSLASKSLHHQSFNCSISDLQMMKSSRSLASLSSESTFTSPSSLKVPEIMCQFDYGVFPVWVSPAQAKTVSRMTAKVQEYVTEGAGWPRSACILDPVRASVVCEGAAQILEVAEWFLKDEPAEAQKRFPVCRVKNKFALSSSELVSLERKRLSTAELVDT